MSKMSLKIAKCRMCDEIQEVITDRKRITTLPCPHCGNIAGHDLSDKPIDKKKVQTILENLAILAKENPPMDKKGNLDVAEFNKSEEVIWVVTKLKEMGVTKKWLWKNGFQIAGMLLRI